MTRTSWSYCQACKIPREMYSEIISQGSFLEFLSVYHGGIQDGGQNMGNITQVPTVSEYNMGWEGDLFKAPEPILDEPAFELDPVAAAISIISSGGDITTETIKVADIESNQDDNITDIFYDCKNPLDKSEIEESISELLEVKIHAAQIEVANMEKDGYSEGTMQKSVSSGCLNSVERIPNCTMGLDFLDFQGLDFEAAFGLRRAYSEGDIQNLGNKDKKSIGSRSTVCSSFEQLLTIRDLKAEERKQKLSRYRKKKSKRNFSKKIKYACRKALADGQPRIRGRFAKTDSREPTKLNI